MTIPLNEKNCPVVIFVHGSGPNDRDESIGPNKPFRDIAYGLARLGIATLRYDKRTYLSGVSNATSSDAFDLDTEVLIDVASACRQMDSMNRFSKIFVLGHSLGAMLAPKIANQNPHIDGIIMLAGNARPLETLIWEQYNYIMQRDGLDDYEKNALSKLEVQLQNLEKLKLTGPNEALELPIGLPEVYWQSLNAYRQTEEIKSVKCKILILQGERDYQVKMEDFQLWKYTLRNHENVEFKSYSKLNHLFMEGEGPSYPEEYQMKRNVATYVIDDIAEWIHR